MIIQNIFFSYYKTTIISKSIFLFNFVKTVIPNIIYTPE